MPTHVILPVLFNLTILNVRYKLCKLKGKIRPITGHQGPRGGILNPGARRGWVVSTTPLPLYPRKDPKPIVQEAGWAPGPVWTCAKNLAPAGIFFLICRILCFIVLVMDFQLSFVSYRTACCGYFQQEKSDGFGRERTRDLGYQRPACRPLDHRSRYSIPGPSSP
jgi:hypothetical protein